MCKQIPVITICFDANAIHTDKFHLRKKGGDRAVKHNDSVFHLNHAYNPLLWKTTLGIISTRFKTVHFTCDFQTPMLKLCEFVIICIKNKIFKIHISSYFIQSEAYKHIQNHIPFP